MLLPEKMYLCLGQIRAHQPFLSHFRHRRAPGPGWDQDGPGWDQGLLIDGLCQFRRAKHFELRTMLLVHLHGLPSATSCAEENQVNCRVLVLGEGYLNISECHP